MTREEVIRLAKEAEALCMLSNFAPPSFDFGIEQLERFAELVAAEYKQDAERYRFFIKHLDLTDQLSPLHILMSKIGDRTPTKVELDAAIDKAMEQTK